MVKVENGMVYRYIIVKYDEVMRSTLQHPALITLADMARTCKNNQKQLSSRGKTIGKHILKLLNLISSLIWRLPEIGVPLNHRFQLDVP